MNQKQWQLKRILKLNCNIFVIDIKKLKNKPTKSEN